MLPLETLTKEQESLISVYGEKWGQVALSTKPIVPAQAITTLEQIYQLCEQPQPEIKFVPNPLVGLKILSQAPVRPRINPLYTYLLQQPQKHFQQCLNQKCSQALQQYLRREFDQQLRPIQSLFYLIQQELTAQAQRSPHHWHTFPSQLLKQSISPCSWLSWLSWFDYCVSVLGIFQPQSHWQLRWQLLQAFSFHCGWIFPAHGVCVVCDRPVELRLNDKQELHREGEPALRWGEGLEWYGNEGTIIPERYGKMEISQWQSALIEKERNSDWLRTLLPRVGWKLKEELSPSALEQIAFYQQKWYQKRRADRVTDTQKLTEGINQGYELLGLPKPEIIWVRNPTSALNYLREQSALAINQVSTNHRLTNLKWNDLISTLIIQLRNQIERNLEQELQERLCTGNERWDYAVGFELSKVFGLEAGHYFPISPSSWHRLWGKGSDLACNQPDVWGAWGALLDFSFSVLGCVHNEQVWQVVQIISDEAGFLFPYEDKMIVVERPLQIRIDQSQTLTKPKKIKLLFADDTCFSTL